MKTTTTDVGGGNAPIVLAPEFSPSPTVERFMLAVASGPSDELRMIILSGPRGEGKTSGGIWACLMLAQRLVTEGALAALPVRIAVVRDTWANIRRTTINSFEENARRGLPITFVDGAREAIVECDGQAMCHFYFFGLDNRQDVDKLQGFQCGILWLEEVAPAAELSAGIPPEALGVGATSLRQPGVPRRIIVTMNPSDEDHWILSVERHLLDAGLEGVVVARFDIPPGEKSSHFRTLASRAASREEREAWDRAAREFDRYRQANEVFLRSIGRSDLVERLVLGRSGGVQVGEPLVPEFKRKLHCTRDFIPPLPSVPIIRAWDGGRCYDDQTEVLTEYGWRLFRDLTGAERLATRHPTTGEVEYQYPIRLVAEPHDGPMWLYESPNANFVVTPEHLIPVVPEREWANPSLPTIKRSADELARLSNPHAALCLRAKWVGEDPAEVGAMKWPPSVWARFCGWWLGDGSVKRNTVMIYQEKPSDDLERLLAETGLDWRPMTAYGRRVGWKVWCPALAAEVASWGRLQKDRRIPQALRSLKAEYLSEFLAALVAADGYRRVRNGIVEEWISTSSEGLAGDIQEVAMLAGRWARVLPRPARDTILVDRGGRKHVVRGRSSWRVILKGKGRGVSCLLGKNWKRIHYVGTRYCATVPNGTLYVRRKGIAHWNGNTPSCVWLQQMQDGNVNIIGSRMGVNQSMGEFILEHVLPFQAKYGLRPPGEDFAHGLKRGFRFRDIGDPALWKKNEVSRSLETACWVIENMLHTTVEKGPVAWDARRQALKTAFYREGIGPDRAKLILIYEPECKTLVQALAGRARYPKDPKTGRVIDTVQALKNESGDAFQELDALAYALAVIMPADEWLKRRIREPVPSAPKRRPRSWVGI